MRKKVKRERGSNIIFPIILELLGRILIGEKGKETGKIKIFKRMDGAENQVLGNFIHP